MCVCAAPLFRYVNCAKYFRSSAIVRPRRKESEMDYSGASERRYISQRRWMRRAMLQPRQVKKEELLNAALFIISSSYFMIKKE